MENTDQLISKLRTTLQTTLRKQKEIKYSLDMQKHTYLCLLAKSDILLSKIGF